ncbi:hypothetical protein KM043_016686 [Ampulex compressa]|nr:hypothetical protein KM043_016686 [Ampulex compressa]
MRQNAFQEDPFPCQSELLPADYNSQARLRLDLRFPAWNRTIEPASGNNSKYLEEGSEDGPVAVAQDLPRISSRHLKPPFVRATPVHPASCVTVREGRFITGGTGHAVRGPSLF